MRQFTTQHILYAVNMGRMEGDVVYCSQNAMLVLPRKMLKILYQLCAWSTSVRMWYILCQCMLMLSKYWEHICYI